MKRLSLVAAALVLFLSACGGSENASSNGSGPEVLDVVVTTPQLADFVQNVGGRDVKVRNVLRPGVDPHEFEPTPADVQSISNADVVVRNGVGLESWFDATVKAASPKGAIVDASQGVQLRTAASAEEPSHSHEAGAADEHNHAEGEFDPHIWQNPRNAKVMVNNITTALKAAGPIHAAKFDQAKASYDASLDQLDAETERQLASLPDKRLVTDHDSLGYFVDRYGLQFVGSVIPTFNSQAELSPGQINDTVAKIRATGTRAIFVSKAVSPRVSETIARETGAKVVSGDNSLYTDTLAASGEPSTYIGAVRHNARVIATNLR